MADSSTTTPTPFVDKAILESYHDAIVEMIPKAIGPVQLNVMVTGWVGDVAPYTQTFQVAGVTAGMNNLTLNPINITNDTERASYMKAIACLMPAAEIGDGTVTLKAHTKPEMDFIMMLKGVSV